MHVYIYTITCVEGFKREDEYERRDDDMRSNTISYGRKKDITSREEKEERKNREKHTVKAMPVRVMAWGNFIIPNVTQILNNIVLKR